MNPFYTKLIRKGKTILPLVLAVCWLITGCSNEKKEAQKIPSTGTPATPAPPLVSTNPDSTLIIHPNPTMERVVVDVNGHINNIPLSENMDTYFINVIKVHNQTLMEMAYLESLKGQHPRLKSMASGLIERKKAENIALEKLKNRVNNSVAQNDSFQHEISRQLRDKFFLPATSTLSVDEQFAILILPHHQTAINLGRIYLRHATNSELRRFAEKMIKDYQQAIAEIRTIEKELKI